MPQVYTCENEECWQDISGEGERFRCLGCDRLFCVEHVSLFASLLVIPPENIYLCVQCFTAWTRITQKRLGARDIPHLGAQYPRQDSFYPRLDEIDQQLPRLPFQKQIPLLQEALDMCEREGYLYRWRWYNAQKEHVLAQLLSLRKRGGE